MAAAEVERQVESLQAARLTTADGADLLARLAESGMVDNGQVVVLGLDAIRSRFGDRWARKSEQVWDAAMLHIRRRLGPGDIAARIGEVDAVIAVAGGRDHAQAVGLAIMQELLIFFLGEARASDLKLNAVAWVSGAEIGCAPIDAVGALSSRPPGESAAFAPPGPKAAGLAPHLRPAPPTPWSALNMAVGQGRSLSARCVTQTLIGLANGLPMGLRVDAQIQDPLSGRVLDPAMVGLSTAEALALDLSTVTFARTLASEGGAVLTPLSYETVSTSRGRSQLLARPGVAARMAPMVEIVGVDAGTPQGRLTETVALVHPFARAVVARIDLNGDLRPRLKALQGARLDGLSIDLGGLPAAAGDERMIHFAAHARGATTSMLVFGLPDHASLERAAAVGFTHATLADEG